MQKREDLWVFQSYLSVNLSHPFCIIKSVSSGHLLFLTGHVLDFLGCSHCLRSPFGVRSDGGSKPTGVEE